MTEGWRLQDHASLPSTSDHLIALAERGEGHGLAVLARRQTAGRGRQGRAWEGREGNLHLSLLLRPDEAARTVPQWGLVAAVAVAEAIAERLPDPSALRLKWPNDVMIGGAKAAGILVDARLDGAARLDWLVIGIGANLAWAPELPDRPTTSLAAQGAASLDPGELAWALIARLDHWCALRAGQGFEPCRRAWLALGPAHGAMLSVRSPTGGPEAVLTGRYEGLSEDGRLLLRSNERVHALSAGELVG